MGLYSDTKLDNLQTLQSRAKKLIENGKHKDGWVSDWLTVKKLIKYDGLVMAHKILNGKYPENFQESLPRDQRSQVIQLEIVKICTYPSLD